LRSKHLQAIVIPKVHAAKDVHFVCRMIDSVAPVERREHIRLILSIESALGIQNLREIATSDPRVSALLFAAEDYCADLGMLRTSHRREMLYARSAVVTAACAFGLQSIDMVCIDYNNEAVLREECQEGREMAFTGKQAIHPGQIAIIHDMYRPADEDIARAVRIIAGHEEHSKVGVGAFGLDGKLIDMPVVKWAERLLARARSAGVAIPDAASLKSHAE
ncbi:Pyruvate/Phosphoenolpyruvate kinase-like domain-containing protein, partial [Thamnocephalis sphaerospora]